MRDENTRNSYESTEDKFWLDTCGSMKDEIRLEMHEIKNSMACSAREALKQIFTVGVVSKIILLVILLIVHEYTGGGRVVTDMRELFIWDDLLCADNFVVLGILIICVLQIRDYFLIFKRMFYECWVDEAWDEDEEEFNLATEIIRQLEEYRGQNDGKIVQFPTNRQDMHR